jgi:hypothetical protein
MLDTTDRVLQPEAKSPKAPVAIKTAQFEAEALLVLRHLCETGAVLAVARD